MVLISYGIERSGVMILITGATGVVGREAVQLLVDHGAKVAAITRNPRSELPAGARLVHPDAMLALDGADGILLSPRAVGAGVAGLPARAREAATNRVVVLSAMTVQYPAGYARFRDQFEAVEDIAKAAGPDWTILRCANFAANSLARASWTRSPRLARRSAATCRLLRSRRTTYAAACSPPASPEDVPDRLLGSLATCAREPLPTTDTVRRLLGRPARTNASRALDHSAAFAREEHR
jgi:uncharacterized protein YbjT (DUF2867 family)